MIFDERLTELRKGLGITQKDFAEKLQIEPSKYNKWENGKTVPDFETVIKLANHFDVTVDYLIGNSDAQRQEDESIIDDLGLTNESLKTLRLLKDLKEGFQDNENDERSQLDVLNSVIPNVSFLIALTAIRILTNKNKEDWPVIVDEPNLKMTKEDLYKRMIFDSVEPMLEEIKSKQTRGKASSPIIIR